MNLESLKVSRAALVVEGLLVCGQTSPPKTCFNRSIFFFNTFKCFRSSFWTYFIHLSAGLSCTRYSSGTFCAWSLTNPVVRDPLVGQLLTWLQYLLPLNLLLMTSAIELALALDGNKFFKVHNWHVHKNSQRTCIKPTVHTCGNHPPQEECLADKCSVKH